METIKRFYPIFSTGDKICIGLPKTKSYLEIENTGKNYKEKDINIQKRTYWYEKSGQFVQNNC